MGTRKRGRPQASVQQRGPRRECGQVGQLILFLSGGRGQGSGLQTRASPPPSAQARERHRDPACKAPHTGRPPPLPRCPRLQAPTQGQGQAPARPPALRKRSTQGIARCGGSAHLGSLAEGQQHQAWGLGPQKGMSVGTRGWLHRGVRREGTRLREEPSLCATRLATDLACSPARCCSRCRPPPSPAPNARGSAVRTRPRSQNAGLFKLETRHEVFQGTAFSEGERLPRGVAHRPHCRRWAGYGV